jgi:phosphate/sulfate permease
MKWNGAKKIIWLLIASTLLSTIFSMFMMILSMKIKNDVSFLRRKLCNSGDNAIRFQKYRKP